MLLLIFLHVITGEHFDHGNCDCGDLEGSQEEREQVSPLVSYSATIPDQCPIPDHCVPFLDNYVPFQTIVLHS